MQTDTNGAPSPFSGGEQAVRRGSWPRHDPLAALGGAKCLACGAPAWRGGYPHDTRFDGAGYRFFACAGCGAHFINPVPDAATLARMYAPDAYHQAFYADDGRANHDTMITHLRAHLTDGARVLDYGCGNGDFLRAALAAGFLAQGAEFGASAADAAAERSGASVFDLMRGDWRDADEWDAIHLGDVIEHMTDPLPTLAGIVARLRPGGVLAAQGPLELNGSLIGMCVRAWARAKAARGQQGSFIPWHVLYFDARAQRALFDRLGLHPIAWQVHEDGWPYSHHGGARGMIARMGVALARLPGLRGRWGNRFVALYRKPAAG
ncbi:methyltransferase domain-containing protein [Novosphingobium sp. FSY-8]|uniref:Methyltransferase domain-containing protein n=1 Tax=Novosphingobium ovatum TaxID=1908523 RepID=A0ABW9X8U4_9SPHN|nr:class I SAM-dependent methyltransferase [Novosphingobium ovatum]NBC34941.1 methyltransferase domain-containing protein [Novosphingobium ovatum]